MLNGYDTLLINIKELYPELYIQLLECNPDIIKGWINDFVDEKIALEDEETIKTFFKVKLVFHNQWKSQIFVYAPFVPASFQKGIIR